MRWNRHWPTVVAVVIYCLLDCDSAFAWGPGVHVSLAGDVLSHAAWLPAAIGAVITRYVRDYLYGTIAADVVFAKRLSRIKQFCHHWSTGFAVLDRARDDRGRAFAYGYLSHLAADTVAHGKFVPRQIAISGFPVNLGHLYWEVRADGLAEEAVWDRLRDLLTWDHEDHHAVLAGLLTRTFLSFETNRQLFRGINRLVGLEAWRRTMDAWQRRSVHELPPVLLDQYRRESLDRMVCLLTSLRRSPVLFEDPNGTAALGYIRAHRRDRRRLDRRGLAPTHLIHEAAASHAPAPWPVMRSPGEPTSSRSLILQTVSA